jgi:hypothetical protein
MKLRLTAAYGTVSDIVFSASILISDVFDHGNPGRLYRPRDAGSPLRCNRVSFRKIKDRAQLISDSPSSEFGRGRQQRSMRSEGLTSCGTSSTIKPEPMRESNRSTGILRIVTHARDKVFIHLQLCWAGTSLDEEQRNKEEKKTENASSRQTLLGIYQSAPRIADGE